VAKGIPEMTRVISTLVNLSGVRYGKWGAAVAVSGIKAILVILVTSDFPVYIADIELHFPFSETTQSQDNMMSFFLLKPELKMLLLLCILVFVPAVPLYIKYSYLKVRNPLRLKESPHH
jgi:hypothetical protein